jgi:subtilisin family serine protease
MKKVSVFILSLLLILASSALSADEKTNKKEIPDVPSFIGYVPNEIVVKFDHSITTKKDKKSAPKGKLGIPSLDQMGSRHNVISVLPQFPKAKKKKYKGREIDLSGWHKIKFGRKVDVEAVVKEYKKIPGVIDAQPIGVYSLYASYPNDPDFDGDNNPQWHLDQKVVNRCDPNVDADIDAPESWDTETGDDTLVVAVLDTGVRYFHQDLGGSSASSSNPENTDGNIWINSVEKNGDPGQDDEDNDYIDDWIGYDFVDGATNTDCSDIFGLPPGYINCPCWDGEDCEGTDNDPRDFHGHGTHVAGIVAAMNNNGYMTSSTAGGWGNGNHQPEGNGVKIMPLRICYSAGNWLTGELGLCRMDFAAQALYYAADNGAHFVNASWGSGNEGGIAEAIDYFLASGGIIFKAAGNDGGGTADYINGRTDPGIISVAATDCNDCMASFSTHGNWVDISAPGKDIWSTYHDHQNSGTDSVESMSGTSMASPLALSVAALIWSEYPTLTACQVEERLYESADDIYGLACNSPYVGKLGFGRVNAFNAVNIECSSDDSDNDSFSPCMGDCDDSNASINPEAIEICDGLDNDCDCSIDEDFPKNVSNATLTCNSGVPNLSCNNDYYDCDGDLENGCESSEFCLNDHDEDGYSSDVDCNDYVPSIHPGATELCDGLDNDCDGTVPANEADADSDGYRICENDCDDSSPTINPGATEVCNDVDDNCDGSIDEGVKLTFYLDFDNDGFGDPAQTTQACTVPAGYVSDNTDCNDNDLSIHPGAGRCLPMKLMLIAMVTGYVRTTVTTLMAV